MNWLFDSPFTILLGALGIGLFIGVAWVQTGKNAFLFAIGGVVVAAIALLALERSVETDTEKITKLLYQIAAEIEANDAETVLEHVISSRPELAKRGRAEMQNHTFTRVAITKIFSVEEFPQKQPPAVVAQFNVNIAGNFMKGQMPLDGQVIFFKLTFWKDHDGQWRIADYEYDANRPFPRGSG